MEMKQIEVKRKDVHRVVWTECDDLIKPGNCIRFKNEDKFWDIVNVFDTIIDKEEINRTWHVGGL